MSLSVDADHIVVSTGQMLGGIVASAILDGLTPGPLAVGVSLGQGANRTQGYVIYRPKGS
jgi:aquaporin related protein